jgi:hypothetical protein
VQPSGLRWHEAELLRVSGEARHFADPDRAGRDLGAAIAVAREQGARTFELRAALSLAKLYQSIGRPVEVKAVLACVRIWRRPPEISAVRRLIGGAMRTRTKDPDSFIDGAR